MFPTSLVTFKLLLQKKLFSRQPFSLPQKYSLVKVELHFLLIYLYCEADAVVICTLKDYFAVNDGKHAEKQMYETERLGIPVW